MGGKEYAQNERIIKKYVQHIINKCKLPYIDISVIYNIEQGLGSDRLITIGLSYEDFILDDMGSTKEKEIVNDYYSLEYLLFNIDIANVVWGGEASVRLQELAISGDRIKYLEENLK